MEEEIVIPIKCHRVFIQQHKEWIFLYSNDYFNKGCEGMAWQFVGEENAFMLPSCYKMCANQRHFHDGRFEHAKLCMDEWFNKIPQNKIIIPMPKMGLGCSRLKELAPKCYEYYKSLIDKIKYKNIRYEYLS